MNLNAKSCVAWGPLVVAAVGFAMLLFTWRTWPDPILDFGRELYNAWRLSEGDTLYRDLDYYNGPLSPYFNAALFKLFGVSLLTLAFANLVILATISILLYRLIVAVAPLWTASLAVSYFLIVHGFGRLMMPGNYNFICPYSHEMTHGIALCLGLIFTLNRAASLSRVLWTAIAGILFGLILLTRSEIVLAASLATAPYAWSWRDHKARSRLPIFVVSALVPPGLAFGLLSLRLPAGEAAHALTLPYCLPFNTALTNLEFFRATMGTLDTWASLRSLGVSLLVYALVIGPAFIAALRLRPEAPTHRRRVVLVFCLYFVVAARLWGRLPPADMALPFPAILILLGIWVMWRMRGAEPEQRKHEMLKLSLIAFSLGMTAKMLLHCRLLHYGFALAAPAAVLILVALTHWIPRALDSLGRQGRILSAAAVALVMVMTGSLFGMESRVIRTLHAPVGGGADAFWTDTDRGIAFNAAVTWMSDHVAPGQTCIAMPEGAMLNYLTCTKNPTPHTNFMPTEIAIFGEETMLQNLQAAPPDYIILVDKSTIDFGFRFFGLNYAKKIGDWVRANYHGIEQIGQHPLEGRGFGILFMKRKSG